MSDPKAPRTLGVTLPRPSTQSPATKSIHEILSDPESLMALSQEQLKSLLAPYIPAARKAILPEEKPSKVGLHARVMADVLKDPRIAADLARLREAREKQTKG